MEYGALFYVLFNTMRWTVPNQSVNAV